MDKVSDFMDNLKDRLANPLIFSFLLSWIGFNWRVIIGLFWYDAAEIHALGYASYFDFVEQKVYPPYSFRYPLCVALLYVVFNPVAKHIFKLINVTVKKIFDKWIFKIQKDTPINFELYQQKVNELQAQHNLLADSVRNAKETKQNVENLEKKLHDEVNTNKKLSDEIKDYYNNLIQARLELEQEIQTTQTYKRKQHDVAPLNGNWVLQYGDNFSDSLHLHIQNGSAYQHGLDFKNRQIFTIKNYLYQKFESGEINVFFNTVDSNGIVKAYNLTYKVDRFFGDEDYKRPVTIFPKQEVK